MRVQTQKIRVLVDCNNTAQSATITISQSFQEIEQMESEGASSFVKKDDGMLALTILAIALVIVAIGGYFMWKNRPVTDSR